MELSSLPNIGKVLERLLIESGVGNPEQLKALGAKQAFIRIRMNSDPGACIRVLYALQGAIDGIKDTELSVPVKNELKEFFRSL